MTRHKPFIYPHLVTITILLLLTFFASNQAAQAKSHGSTHAGADDRAPTYQLGQPYLPNEININPSEPTKDDLIQIIPQGTWGSGCVPRYESHQITGSLIRIDALSNPSGFRCTSALTSWQFTLDIDSLRAGTYAVELYVSTAGNPPLLKNSTSFVVAKAPIYVNPNATGANDGSSSANAYTDLQEALAAAEVGDEIWLVAGTYKPTSGDDRSAAFQLKSGVSLYGGFNGTETSREQRDWVANPTILSGDLLGNDNDNLSANEPTRADNSYHVVYAIGVSGNAILDGLIITGGNANGSDTNRYGGGMYAQKSILTIINTTFTGNTANYGGGMYNKINNPMLLNATFSHNSASLYGGGMYNEYSNPTLIHSILTNNSAFFNGGGMYNALSSRPMLIHDILTGNSASLHGGGIYNTSDSHPTIWGSILWNNEHRSGRGATAQMTGSSATVSYSLLQGGWSGNGNLDGDPLFMDAANGDLRLQRGSPAIDAGDNSLLPADTTDLDGDGDTNEPIPVDRAGNERVLDDIVDIGAYEYYLLPQPTIRLSPASLIFTLTEGERVSQTLMINNTGTSDLNWSISKNNDWLNISPNSGTIAPNESQSPTIIVDVTNLIAGSHNDTLTITSNDPDEPSLEVPVTLTVIPSSTDFTIELESGWNLVSIPVQSESGEISQLFAPIAANVESVFAYDGCNPAENKWSSYKPSNPPFANTLAEIDVTMGLWINMSEADTLLVSGPEPQQSTMQLCEEWNLVGYPSLQTQPVPNALNSITGAYDLVYAYVPANGTWTQYNPSGPPFANTLNDMQAGVGYWINANQEIELAIINPIP